MKPFWFLGAVLTCGAAPALANPDGAPWGSADPDGFNSCASCHFDHEPVSSSPAIILAGVPEAAIPGERYQLTLMFERGASATAGFLLAASAGDFLADDAGLEAKDGEVRSTAAVSSTAGAGWTFDWRAPSDGETVTFDAAVNGSNDDRSALGDQVHFRRYRVFMTRSP